MTFRSGPMSAELKMRARPERRSSASAWASGCPRVTASGYPRPQKGADEVESGPPTPALHAGDASTRRM